MAGNRQEAAAERVVRLAYEHGDIIAGDDGFYIYWPSQSEQRGALTEWDLRAIADELARINAPWAAEIEQHFSSPNPAEAKHG